MRTLPWAACLVPSLQPCAANPTVSSHDTRAQVPSPTCQTTLKPSPNPNLHCGFRGNLKYPSILAKPNAANLNACRNACLPKQKCISFSFNSANHACVLYNETLDAQGVQQMKGSKTIFYHRNCFITTCCPTSLIANGGFESGSIAPWTLSDSNGDNISSTANIISPGGFGQSSYALAFSTYPDDPSDPGYGAPAYLAQTVNSCPQQQYLLTFSYKISGPENVGTFFYYMSANAPSPAGLFQNYIESDGITVDTNQAALGRWNSVGVTFNSGDATSLTFTSYVATGDSSKNFTILLDDISITSLSSPRILPNGDFETGSLTPWYVFAEQSYAKSGLAEVAIASPGYGGSQYAALLNEVGSDDESPYYQPSVVFSTAVGLTNSTNYTLTFSYLRFENSTGTVFLSISLYHTSFQSQYLSFSGNTTDSLGGNVGVWNTQVYNFTAQEDYAQFVIASNFYGAGNALSLAIDNIAISHA